MSKPFRYPKYTRSCEFCGVNFETGTPGAKTCKSGACVVLRQEQRRSQWRSYNAKNADKIRAKYGKRDQDGFYNCSRCEYRASDLTSLQQHGKACNKQNRNRVVSASAYADDKLSSALARAVFHEETERA